VTEEGREERRGIGVVGRGGAKSEGLKREATREENEGEEGGRIRRVEREGG
jgi:hypothetical protein